VAEDSVVFSSADEFTGAPCSGVEFGLFCMMKTLWDALLL
jgi:hypothetical protein